MSQENQNAIQAAAAAISKYIDGDVQPLVSEDGTATTTALFSPNAYRGMAEAAVNAYLSALSAA